MINDFFEKLEPMELQSIIQKEVYDFIRRKSFMKLDLKRNG
jgi:hypothetical protein